MKLYSRFYIDLTDCSDPRNAIESSLRRTLDDLESTGKPAWDTVQIHIQPDDLVDRHVITITAQGD